MLSIELFLSDPPVSKQVVNEIAFMIQEFFIDAFPDIKSTSGIVVIFPGGYVATGYYESQKEKEKSFQKRILVRVSGKLISKHVIRGEREPSFPWSSKRDAFEAYVKELLTKKEKQEIYFDYQ